MKRLRPRFQVQFYSRHWRARGWQWDVIRFEPGNFHGVAVLTCNSQREAKKQLRALNAAARVEAGL